MPKPIFHVLRSQDTTTYSSFYPPSPNFDGPHPTPNFHGLFGIPYMWALPNTIKHEMNIIMNFLTYVYHYTQEGDGSYTKVAP
jgi:hypothetical protein